MSDREETYITASCNFPTKAGRYWSKEEHDMFLLGINMHGFKSLKEISLVVGTRSVTQTRSHMQKYNLKLVRDTKRLRLGLDSKDGVNIEDVIREEIRKGFSIELQYPSRTDRKEFLSLAECEEMRNQNMVPQSCGLLLLSVVASSVKPLEENESTLPCMKENDLQREE